ncbi:MBL fold metallo-hydrolase [Benzoatithermus flavus]|uniref:Metallo-beta-lactamase domain-containing protein n=1 Tax=Benzoatithermus flavus TaxID=3108223 RepID=A0ABU8XSP8_9PROT
MHAICTTCGTQFAASEAPPERCPVCEDERQYVGWGGQRWTTLEELQGAHKLAVRDQGDGLLGLGIEPKFAIGQRALLVPARAGNGGPGRNVLWDCISLVDAAAVRVIEALGGLSAIAISHPHYYASMVEWSRAFGGVPIWLHAADREWVVRPDPAIRFWDGDALELGPGLTLLRLGGHFAGGTVLHWADGAEGHGVLLAGDILQVVQDRRWLSFMYSYPNYLPLPAATVRRMAAMLDPYPFEHLHGAWFDAAVQGDAKAAVKRSAERYLRALGEG